MSLTEEEVSYDGLGQRVELDIAGMTCAACASRIEKMCIRDRATDA